jgi:PAS domain S-box-containing protein
MILPQRCNSQGSKRNRVEGQPLAILKNRPPHPSDLRRRAETRLKATPAPQGQPQTEADTKRLLHELQVHQLELEMQNAELREARDEVETQLGRYTDLYDFAPVGYYSIDEQGLILDVNLTGAALLGVERSRLINRRLLGFVTPHSFTTLQAFIKKVFTGPEKLVCVVSLLTEQGATFWADLQATPATSTDGEKKWCRVVVSDLTSVKQAEEVLGRMEGLATANRELKLEIVHREMAEAALKKSEAEARHMQEQLRHLTHQLLLTQEEERKRISRELHDAIVQTLVGINVHLSSLTVKSRVGVEDLRTKITRTKRLVEKSVEIVHRFARELRPTVLDDLGLIPALQSFITEFTQRTKIRVRFEACAEVEQLDSSERTVLYRVAQSVLANVDKHAHARNVIVNVRKLPAAISLEIRDDGISFNVKRVLVATRHKRLGLLGSRERIEMVGGKFAIESAPGKGTTIRAEIPIKFASPKGKKKSRKTRVKG